MYLTEDLQRKWSKVLDYRGLPQITDPHKRAVLTVMLENQEKASREQLNEDAPANSTRGFPNNNTNLQGYDPILISLLRRAMPNLIAFDICGVQPMKAPTGMIFALRSRYSSQGGTEALFNEADTDFSGTGTHVDWDATHSPLDGTATTGTGMLTTDAEALGKDANGNDTTHKHTSKPGGRQPDEFNYVAGTANVNDGVFNEMAFSIEKIVVEAKTRALKAEYSMELAQDLKAVHGLDAETELANILSAEILAEINREIVRTIYAKAKTGAQDCTTPGTFDLSTDSNGRWSVEQYKGLMYQLEKEANAIAKDTRRGRGNIIICDSDTASALSVTGMLDCGSALKDNLTVDDTGNTFVGVLNNRFKVYIDPYAPLGVHYAVLGYKGASAYDFGLAYCPYVPLQMVRAVAQDSFAPKIGFKTRYAVAENPFGRVNVSATETADWRNCYYRKFNITNL